MAKSLLLKNAILLALVCFNASANTYMGAEFQMRRMDFRGGYGDNLLPHQSQQGNAYVGYQFDQSIGVEVGFEGTNTRTRNTIVTTGDTVTGIDIVKEVSPVILFTKGKIKGPHVDLVGYYTLDEDLPIELIASVGVAHYKATFERRTVQFADPPVQSQMNRTFCSHRTVLRLMGGIRTMFDEHVGMRLTVGWANTRKMRVSTNDGRFAYAEIRPKDSVIYGIGAFWAF